MSKKPWMGRNEPIPKGQYNLKQSSKPLSLLQTKFKCNAITLISIVEIYTLQEIKFKKVQRAHVYACKSWPRAVVWPQFMTKTKCRQKV